MNEGGWHCAPPPQVAGIPDGALMYVSTKNSVAGQLPYFIAVDEATRSVVVAVRGSFSMADVATDFVAQAALLGEDWLGPGMGGGGGSRSGGMARGGSGSGSKLAAAEARGEGSGRGVARQGGPVAVEEVWRGGGRGGVGEQSGRGGGGSRTWPCAGGAGEERSGRGERRREGGGGGRGGGREGEGGGQGMEEAEEVMFKKIYKSGNHTEISSSRHLRSRPDPRQIPSAYGIQDRSCLRMGSRTDPVCVWDPGQIQSAYGFSYVWLTWCGAVDSLSLSLLPREEAGGHATWVTVLGHGWLVGWCLTSCGGARSTMPPP